MSKITFVSRTLIKDVINNLYNKKIIEKVETRGRKKTEEKYPNIVNQIKNICEKFEVVDKSLKDEIIYVNITLRKIKSKLISDGDYTEDSCSCINTIRKVMIQVLGYKLTKVKKNKVLKKIQKQMQYLQMLMQKFQKQKARRFYPSLLMIKHLNT